MSATGRIPGCAGPAAAHPVSAAGKAPLAPGPRCHVLGSPEAPQGSRWLRRRQLRRQLRRRAFLPAVSSRSAVLSVRPRTIARGEAGGLLSLSPPPKTQAGRCPVPLPAEWPQEGRWSSRLRRGPEGWAEEERRHSRTGRGVVGGGYGSQSQ